MRYILDTNVISDLIRENQFVQTHVFQEKAAGSILYLSYPVYYEQLRGLLWKKASKQIQVLEQKIISLFDWLSVENEDWIQAARFWDSATSQGKQLADVDFLVAAMAYRLSATIISDDSDFDILPIARENWRKP